MYPIVIFHFNFLCDYIWNLVSISQHNQGKIHSKNKMHKEVLSMVNPLNGPLHCAVTQIPLENSIKDHHLVVLRPTETNGGNHKDVLLQ